MPQLTAELLRLANQLESRVEYLTAALAKLLDACDADGAVVAVNTSGKWTAVARSGNSEKLPGNLLADVLDRQEADIRGAWMAAPLATGRGDDATQAAEVVAMHCPSEIDPRTVGDAIAELLSVMSEGLDVVARRAAAAQRIHRLEAVLEIATQWNQTHEMEPLLVQMAEASTRLFKADRASIFLWDRPTHTLVGRPALGVEGGELRIPDDRGVVGQVVRSGRPIRVDSITEPKRIDREVDTRLGYETRTLLCVPLVGRSGELFGAFELINKTSGCFNGDDEAALTELAAHAAIALENAQDREYALSTSRQKTEQAAQGVRMIGESGPIEALRSIVQRVADTDLAVLILGANGTGKEVVAQSIHYQSRRRDKPFVPLNCAAIPEALAESELFGHEKGAFTDAQEARQGKFELAADGTLFLDEIGDLTLGGQAKLLRVLEEKVLIRVGGSIPIHTDARVVAATNQDLTQMVREKRFREDLFFRLNVVTLEIPPLCERGDDIMLLAQHFLGDFCRKARRKKPEFSPVAEERLRSHAWPGNVRELRNLMERLAYLSTDDPIEARELAFILAPQGDSPLAPNLDLPLTEATADFQEEYIRGVLERCGGGMSQAASQLGMHRSNLYRKMRQLGMETG